MKKTKLLFLLGFISLLISSCGINSNMMFRSLVKDANVITDPDSIPISPTEEYVLAPNNRFTFKMYVNGGKRLIDMQSMALMVEEAQSGVGGASMRMQGGGGGGLDYIIRPDGMAEVPILGDINLTGLTIKEAQDSLARSFLPYYQDPFIQLEVTNRRVIIFPGGSGDAQVVPITNNNMTLMEALASSGGISDRGRAKKIKIMRQTKTGRVVYQVDLSTMEGVKYADMVIQANDYIYVQPLPRFGQEFLKELSPILALITTSLFVVSLFSN